MNVLKRSYFDLDSIFFNSFFGAIDRRNDFPMINTSEDVDKFKVGVFFPGGKKDNFKIKLEDNILSVEYKQSDNKNLDAENYHFKEYVEKNFTRRFKIPNEVIKNKITASYEDGVLEIQIPKDKEKEKDNKFEIKIS